MPVPQGRAPLRYSPGPWVALAGPNDVIMLADLAPTSPVAIACWDALDQGAGLDAVLGVILREGLRNVPSFVLAARTDDAIRVLAGGKARADVSGPHGTETLSAADAPATSPWLERTVAGAAGVRLTAEAGSADPASGPTLPLFGGVVLAAAVMLGDVAVALAPTVPAAASVAAPAEPAAAAERNTDEELAAVESFDTIEPPRPSGQQPPAPTTTADTGLIEALPFRVPNSFTSGPASDSPVPSIAEAHTIAAPPVGAPVQAPEPPGDPIDEHDEHDEHDGAAPVAPTVLAVSCPNGHLGPPYSGECRVCSAPTPPQEPYNVTRPMLGILNMSTGDMVPLDRDVVLGRSPSSDETDPQLRPHLVQLASPGNDISRNHVRVSLEGWHVLVTDLDSTNGTVVTVPNQQPVRLRPHDAFTVVPGTLINIADEVNVRFEVPA